MTAHLCALHTNTHRESRKPCARNNFSPLFRLLADTPPAPGFILSPEAVRLLPRGNTDRS